MTARRLHIFPGRFQPFHNDHVSVVKQAIANDLTPLILGIIVNSSSHEMQGDFGFMTTAAEHHLPERNPFSPVARLRMIQRYVKEQEFSEVFPTLIPRPELYARLIVDLFPGGRSWIIPDCGELFDDQKEAYLTSIGEQVIRIPQEHTVDGRIIRSAIFSGSEEWVPMVPAAIANHIKEEIR